MNFAMCSGIGEQIATQLAKRGAEVVLACRSLERGNTLKQKLEQRVEADAGRKAKLEVLELDVADLQSIRRFSSQWLKSGRKIDCLINNAGIFNIAGSRKTTHEGFEIHMGTNYLGPFLLTLLLLPALQLAGSTENPTRVILVNSILHHCRSTIDKDDPHLKKRGSYSSLRAYGQSKYAQVAFAAELRRRLRDDGSIAIFACHPGECATDIARTLPVWIQWVYKVLLPPLLLSPKNGCLSTLLCAVSHPRRVSSRYTDPKCPYIGCGGTVCATARGAVTQETGRWLWQWSCSQVGLDPAECLERH